MTSPDELSVILSEAGPLDETILSVSRMAADRWAVQFAEVDVDIEHDEASGRVMFSTRIGTPPPLRVAQIYEALLSYSLLWRETGGVRMALNGPAGEVVQMIDLSAAELRPDIAVTVAVNLANRTAIWRGFFASEDAEAVPPGEAGFDPFTMIRV